MERYILGLDEGTTSARTLVYDAKENKIINITNEKFKQYFPKSGWVEHDANEIWEVMQRTLNKAIKDSQIKTDEIIGLGITNQRESIVAWNKDTGKSVCPSIVWQCRRTKDYCEKIPKRMKKYIKSSTGLIVDPYFSATKIKWLLENSKPVQKLLKENKLCIGTIDSYLTYRLTKGEHFITDTSNASRTMLFNIKTMTWDEKLLKYFGIPKDILPTVVSNGTQLGTAYTKYGKIKIGAILGDQQSSLFGQGCTTKGLAKATYGTGCFILSNTGDTPIHNDKMLSTVAWTINDKTSYALEGSIFNAGTVVNWLIDNLKVLSSNKESSEICSKLENGTEGVYFVPAFTGMGAPYWNSTATGAIVGLTRATTKDHIIRAGLESMAYNTFDIVSCMEHKGISVKELHVDGGVSRNEFLMQYQADILGKKVIKSESTECTALGVIYMTGLSLKYFKSISEIKTKIKTLITYSPKMSTKKKNQLIANWHNAVNKTLGDN
ncbi:MAG: glycerol kinase GlpK [Clostridia bacterium]|nr:glycerol kinase GlpK [Clostridia bacterium]